MKMSHWSNNLKYIVYFMNKNVYSPVKRPIWIQKLTSEYIQESESTSFRISRFSSETLKKYSDLIKQNFQNSIFSENHEIFAKEIIF